MVVRRAAVAAMAVVVALLARVPSVQGQIRASERGKVAQTVDGTVITVDYSRPQARGRDSLFGRVVRVGEMWTPGANWVTTVEVSHPIRLGGHPVPAGKYSLWMQPGPREWTIHLHRETRRYHTQHPKVEEMVVSFSVPSQAGEHVEVLTFDFPRVGRDGATLRLRWGRTVVPLEILVEPRVAAGLTDDQLAPYLGSYDVTMDVGEGKTVEMKAEVINAKGKLRAVVDGPPTFVMEFIPTGEPHKFMPALLDNEKVFDVEELPLFFDMEGGRAIGFRAMGVGDDVWIRGKRRK